MIADNIIYDSNQKLSVVYLTGPELEIKNGSYGKLHEPLTNE